MLLEFLQSIDHKAILIATKADKLPKSARHAAITEIKRHADMTPIAYSVVEGLGRDAVWKTVLRYTSLGVAAASASAED